MLATLKRQLKRIQERLREGTAAAAMETEELADEERITAMTRICVHAWREMGYMAGSSDEEMWQRAHALVLHDVAFADRMRASAARKGGMAENG